MHADRERPLLRDVAGVNPLERLGTRLSRMARMSRIKLLPATKQLAPVAGCLLLVKSGAGEHEAGLHDLAQGQFLSVPGKEPGAPADLERHQGEPLVEPEWLVPEPTLDGVLRGLL